MATEKKEGAKEQPKDAPGRRTMSAASSTGARSHLECTAGPEKGKTFRIAPAVTVVGRDASCDVVVTETVISRQHCRVERRVDGWFLKNLSANGTLVNKKSVDEVLLADGDEIRIGAKTRLKFVIEEVAALTTGRPQFRPRAVGQADEEAEKAEGQAEEAQPSLFKRRKGLFIGLAAYLLVVVAIAAVLAFRSPKTDAGDDIPVLGLEDTIIPEPGAAALRVLRKEPDGYYCEDALGRHVVIPFEALNSGKAVGQKGIRRALDVRFEYKKDAKPGFPYTVDEKNEGLGEQCKRLGIQQYLTSKFPGNEHLLFSSVRNFQKALAYYGNRTSFVDDPVGERYRQEALNELIDRVQKTYQTAIQYEKSGDPQNAMRNYKLLNRLVPETGNPVWENVSKRMDALKRDKRYKDMKF
jgi:hypothetical protein